MRDPVDAGEVLVFGFYLVDQIDRKLTTGGIDNAHNHGDFVYTNFENTSYWQVNLDGLLLDPPWTWGLMLLGV